MNMKTKTFLFIVLISSGCLSDERSEEKELEVTATAYNSLSGQTSGNPVEGAWGDTLKPGMKAIAVSRDLLDSGLTRGTRVRIDELPGEYKVMDKMNRRWTKKIDIYMGAIEKDAKEWGKRTVTIRWKKTAQETPPPTPEDK